MAQFLVVVVVVEEELLGEKEVLAAPSSYAFKVTSNHNNSLFKWLVMHQFPLAGQHTGCFEIVVFENIAWPDV